MNRENYVRALAIASFAIVVIAAGVFWISSHESDLDPKSSAFFDPNELVVRSEPKPSDSGAAPGLCTVASNCTRLTPKIDASGDANSSTAAGTGATDAGGDSVIVSSSIPGAGAEQTRFIGFADQAQNSLPTFEIFQAKKAQGSETPELIRGAAITLGDVSKRLTEHPELVKLGIEFYRTCYQRKDLLDQVRAICLADYRSWRKKTATDSAPEDLTDVPSTVTNLAPSVPIKN